MKVGTSDGGEGHERSGDGFVDLGKTHVRKILFFFGTEQFDKC